MKIGVVIGCGILEVLVLKHYNAIKKKPQNSLFLFARILVDWLKAKFMGDKSWKKTDSHTEGKIQTLTLFTSLGTQGSRSIKVSVCIKVGENSFVIPNRP